MFECVSLDVSRCLVVCLEIRPPKGCAPLEIYRVEETKGLIDGMGTIRLQGVAMLMAIMGALKAIMCT